MKSKPFKYDLYGKIALVTASSQGIGFGIASALGLAGAKVAVCSRNQKHLQLASVHLKKRGIEHLVVASDLSRKNSAKEIIGKVIKKWGRLDILINNMGGIRRSGTFLELKEGDWSDAFSRNLMTVVRFCREAIPYLKRSHSPRIINISSVVAHQPGHYNPHYSAAKMAVLNLTKYLSNFLAPDRILVNAVSPGIIETEGWESYLRSKSLRMREQERKRAGHSAPLGRLGKVDEVADLVLFLASSRASFVTGANFPVDGGKSRCI